MGKTGWWAKGVVLCGILAGGAAPAMPLKILSFQAGAFWAFQAGGGNSLTAQAAWTPIFELGPIGLRGELGAALHKNSLGDRFLVYNYEALARLGLLPNFTFEAGGGFQSWSAGNGGTKPVVTLGLAFGLMGPIDRIYVAFSHFFQGGGSNQYRAGIGFTF